jgi:protoporphyrinogen oxidase
MIVESSNSRHYECCIIGAGPAGLGAALELNKNGITDIVLIDKNSLVGGLSRTTILDNARFDIGPHRFFTKNKEINKIWHETLGRDFRPVSRLTRIYYKKKYFSYPIKPIELLMQFNMIELAAIFFSFISSRLKKNTKINNYEDWIVHNFGRKLYETFFKSYTEKVWGIPCSQIGAEWAAQRIKGLDILEIIKHALAGKRNKKIKTLIEEFGFPVLGAGQMYEAMADTVTSRGAELKLNSKVIRYNRKDNTINSIDLIDAFGKEVTISASHFFSSIPMAHFFKMLTPADSEEINAAAGMLRHRDHIAVNLLIKKAPLFPDQWIYIHSPDLQMARVTNYNNFSRAMVKDNNKTALSVEYFVFKDKGLWNQTDDSLAQLAEHELIEAGLLEKNEVEKAWVVRSTEAYPVYDSGFQKYHALLKSRIDGFSNFYSIGRGGTHKYNNMDHALLGGIFAARNYLKAAGSPYSLWDINSDGGYLEGG